MHFTPSKFGDVSKLVPQISKTAIILYNNDVNVPLMVCHIFAIDLLKKWLFFFLLFFFFCLFLSKMTLLLGGIVAKF